MFLLDQGCRGTWAGGSEAGDAFKKEKMKTRYQQHSSRDLEKAPCSVFGVAWSCVLGVAALRASETVSWGRHGYSHQGHHRDGWPRVVEDS